MKKFFIAGVFALAMISSSFASTKTVNGKIMGDFAASFANAKNIIWSTVENYEKVSFTLNNERISVFYDFDGNLAGTSKVIAFDKLPKAAIETITTKYTFPKYVVKECIEFVNSDNEKDYYISLEKAKEIVVVKINTAGDAHVFSRTKK